MQNTNEVFPYNEKHLRTFIAEYNEFYPPIKYFCWKILEDKETAEAVTLYAFIELWNNGVLYKDRQQIEHYLFRNTGIACYLLEQKQPRSIWFKPLKRERYRENHQYASLAREATTFNELAKVFQDPGSPETYKNITSLFVKHLTGIATTAENILVEEWTSLSMENRNWFDCFNSYNYQISGIGRMEEIYKDANPNDCLQLLHKYRQVTRRCLRETAGYAAAAAVLIFFSASWFYIHLFPKVINKPTVAQTAPAVKKPAAPIATHSDSPVKGNYSENPGQHEKPIKRPARQTREPLPASEVHQQPDVQFTDRNFIEAWSNEGPRQKEHRIINMERAILPFFLPDGSTLILNAGSAIKYPDEFDNNNRKVTLNGEAWFTVVQDAPLPFLVAANGVHIESSGGAFNVRCYLNENQTTVTALTADSLLVVAGPYKLKLQAGQTAVIKKGSPMEVHKTVNAEKTVAYTERRFHFENDNINQVAAEIARWYGLTVAGVDSTNTTVSFEGSRLMKVENVIKKLVTAAGKSSATLKGNQLIIH